jgi:hypothetical protein
MISTASSRRSWRTRAAGPGDVLVEVLPTAEAEGEPAAGQHADGGRLLCYHRGVVAERRAGHEPHQRQPLGRLSRRAEHGPGVRQVALLLEPWEVMVGHHGEVEARCFRLHQVGDQLPGRGLLAHRGVSELNHGGGLPVRVRLNVAVRLAGSAGCAARPGSWFALAAPGKGEPMPRAQIKDLSSGLFDRDHGLDGVACSKARFAREVMPYWPWHGWAAADRR